MRGDGRREDRLRAPVSELAKATGRQLGMELVVHDEVTLRDLRSRPDLAVDARSGRVGFIELKAPGKGTPLSSSWRPTAHDQEQWQRLQVLPNLIYTDGNDWALFQKDRPPLVARIEGDLARGNLRPTSGFKTLLRDFLEWRPDNPTSLGAIVRDIAPLCSLLRDQVNEILEREAHADRQPFTRTALEWQDILFATSGREREGNRIETAFPDAYAQAVTFGLLLARVDGVAFEDRTPAAIAEQLAKQHSLLGQALTFLARAHLVRQLSVVDTLVRVIGAIDWSRVQVGDADTYARLYETFLGEYDPALRRRSGTYYTPAPVARAIVGFVDVLLKTQLDRPLGFATDDVVVLDPAMGAGTFLAEVLENAADTMRRTRRSDAVPAAHLRDLFERRLVGFELQVAPFAVAELRLHTVLRRQYGVEVPAQEPRYLTDTLANPDTVALDRYGHLSLYDVLAEFDEQARRVKRDVAVMVVLGNPPWREHAKRAAPWLTERRRPGVPPDLRLRPSMDEFRPSGQPLLEHNLNNMWTFFWRWSCWKAFEGDEPCGVVALITPSAYLASAGYAGMREHLRRTADAGWVIDLSPENHRSDARTRVFPTTQQPICIGIFLRTGSANGSTPATINYTALHGSREDKFAALSRLRPEDSAWQECPEEWTAPFRPVDAIWSTFPSLADLLPWQQPGVKANRNWVHAPDHATLRERWHRLITAPPDHKSALFKETRDRTLHRTPAGRQHFPTRGPALAEETSRTPCAVPVTHRSFDRQVVLHDLRVVDFPRPELWQVHGERQVYLVEQHTYSIQEGLPAYFSALVPSNDCLIGHHGGRVLPLHRDASGTVANLPPTLLSTIEQHTGLTLTAEDLLAYIAGVIGHRGFTKRFRSDLAVPGVRVPLATSRELWHEAMTLGQRVVWLHTYGQRFIDPAADRPRGIPARHLPIYTMRVCADEDHLPTSARYDDDTGTIVLGEDRPSCPAGRVAVRREVWEYTTGGMPVVRKWLGYRRPEPGRRRRTSPLDDINPTRWTTEFDDHLLQLLAVLDLCIDLEPQQDDLLARVTADQLITTQQLHAAGVLPAPRPWHRPPLDDTGLPIE
jgi:hypothetical protein